MFSLNGKCALVTGASGGIGAISPATIRNNLVLQVTGSVRWRESMEWLGAAGITRFVEAGTGKVLSGIAKRIVPGCEAVSMAIPEDVTGFIL